MQGAGSALGEAHLLLEEHDIATRYYQQAVMAAAADSRLGELISVRANIDLLRSAGLTAETEFLDMQLGSVVTFSGNMVDSPERLKAGYPSRFPNSPKLIAAVSEAIAISPRRFNGYLSPQRRVFGSVHRPKCA